ncbi:MAG TPA: phosphotransferase [Solirubrobacteraceae bacterium]|nr:phosphotransferase [Solirubrobacteraceae bacterium]
MPEPLIGDLELAELLDDESLRDWIAGQRWYGAKARSITGVEIMECLPLSQEPPVLLTLVQTRFATGTHELYQLPLMLARPDHLPDGVQLNGHAQAPISSSGEWSVYDGLAHPAQARALLALIAAGEEIETSHGRFTFTRAPEVESFVTDSSVRAMGVEQSNSSVVFDNQLVLKVFRKLEPGINPELEMLRFLSGHGFQHIAPLKAFYEYDGQALAATLGVAQTFLPEAVGGWELALEEIPRDPEDFLARLGSLGQVTAEMHTVLASDAGDPAFSPEEPSQEALALLTATVDEDIERIFVRLPDSDAVAPIAGCGQDVRERLAARAQVGTGGRVIRTHGDYHLGQTLSTPRGWLIIDFEGEPARALPERRQKRSPLRDVAGMLRSFAYVTSAVEMMPGRQAPADFEQRARQAFLDAYLTHVDPTLLPAGEAAIANLLSIYELEKAIYELQYELNNRPDWVPIPVAGIRRLLETA